MPVDGIERIDEDHICMDGFTVAATADEEAILRTSNKEDRYNFIMKTGQK